MKVVINTCYGGFGLSHEAMLRYAEIKGIKLYLEKQNMEISDTTQYLQINLLQYFIKIGKNCLLKSVKN